MHNKTIQILFSFIIFGIIISLVMPIASHAEDMGAKNQGGFNVGILELIRDVNKDATASATHGEKNLANVIKRADDLITVRINQLNSLLTRINSDKRLDDSEKNSLSSEIQTTITGLNTLKTKIDADTDATTATSDAKTIFTGYRVYEILEPKISLLVMLNNIKAMATNLHGLLPKLQSLIDSFGSQGKDITQINALMDDMNTQITTISTAVDADIVKVEAVTVTTADAKTIFSDVKSDIQNTVKVAFDKIRTDIAAMRPLIKAFVESTPEPTATP